jgi:hypothetical protein
VVVHLHRLLEPESDGIQGQKQTPAQAER